MSEYEDKLEHGIVPIYVEDEMKVSYIDYAMSVIIGRALPNVRDGLKPVHLRILYAMRDLGLVPSKSHKKSARIVGEVLGKYHPHGDTAVYDAMVRMAQPFAMRYPLVDGHGNFGSVDGDNAAAMRYTEARLSKLAMEMLEDIEKDTVDWRPNFDDSLKEPVVLPSKIPNLLLNGSSGIAVGMATNIPPHNLCEIVEGLIAVIDDPEIQIEELMQHVTAPDFPTGGIINGKAGINSAYRTGRGIIKLRGKYDVEEKKNKNWIVITEIPYQVNKSKLLEAIADQVRSKNIEGISDLRDESDRKGMRIVVELKRDVEAEVVANYLFKNTQLEVSFGINLLSITGGKPQTMTLRGMLNEFIEHRKDIIVRRTKYELELALKRAHILEGLIKALDNIDEIIKLIRASKNPAEAKVRLMETFDFTDIQAQAILDMRLQKLTSLEVNKLIEELAELHKRIEHYRAILGSEVMVLDMIKDDLIYLKNKYGDERRTEVVDQVQDITLEDMIQDEEEIITITHSGYIKRVPVDTYKTQHRGGKGVTSGKRKEADFIEILFKANTLDYLLLFTNTGKVYWLKVYFIPRGSREAKGKPLINLVNRDKDERFTAVIPVRNFSPDRSFVMITKFGKIKRVTMDLFSNVRKNGIRALNFATPEDELVSVLKCVNEDQIFIATKYGKAIRFKATDVRNMGRTAVGVKAINLRDGDEVITSEVVPDDKFTIFTVTEKGYGKRTKIAAYRLQKRGGIGIRNIIVDFRNGEARVSSAVLVDDELMIITKNGKLIRIFAKQVRSMGRSTKGVRIINLGDDDEVIALERIIKDDEVEAKIEATADSNVDSNAKVAVDVAVDGDVVEDADIIEEDDVIEDDDDIVDGDDIADDDDEN